MPTVPTDAQTSPTRCTRRLPALPLHQRNRSERPLVFLAQVSCYYSTRQRTYDHGDALGQHAAVHIAVHPRRTEQPHWLPVRHVSSPPCSTTAERHGGVPCRTGCNTVLRIKVAVGGCWSTGADGT